MHARIEPVSGYLRVWTHKVDDSVYNGFVPYEVFLGIKWLDEHTIEIKGLTEEITPTIWRSIIKECQECGIDCVKYIRIKDGRKVEKTIGVGDKNAKRKNS